MTINKTTQYTINPDTIPVNTLTGSQTIQESLDNRVFGVLSMTEMKALGTAVAGTLAKIHSTGRKGVFKWNSGDFSSEVSGDPGQGVWVAPTSDPSGASGAWSRVYDDVLDVKWFGAVGDGVADDTTGLQAAIDYAIQKGETLYLSPGTYNYSSLDNLKTPNLTIKGAGSSKTVLNYTGTGVALSMDAFIDGSPSDPFVNGVSFGGLSLIGNTMDRAIYAQGVARSHFWDIRINGTSEMDGTIGLDFEGVMLSKFDNIVISYVNGNVPYRGLRINEGRRAGTSVGHSANNTFYQCYFEGMGIGIQMVNLGADQNTFIGGSPEACSVYGAIVGDGNRYNSFIGVGFENLGSTADVADNGDYTRYINCYSSQSFLIQALSRGISVEGGYFERIDIASGATTTTIQDVTVNHWDTGAGGYFDSGTGTKYRSVYDADAAAFIYPSRPRAGITVGASPFVYTNNDLVPIQVRVYSGTVSRVEGQRGGDVWELPNPTSADGGNCGIYLVMPGDAIEVTYSSTPVMNKIPLNAI